jgi:hypothetical protein
MKDAFGAIDADTSTSSAHAQYANSPCLTFGLAFAVRLCICCCCMIPVCPKSVLTRCSIIDSVSRVFMRRPRASLHACDGFAEPCHLPS